MRDDRRRILGVIGAGLSVGVAGCSAFSMDDGSGSTSERSGDEAETTTDRFAPSTSTEDEGENGTDSEKTLPEKIEPSPEAYRSVPLPSEPSEHAYATMGADDASVTAEFYGAWKCPYTHDFVMNFLPTIIEEYVEPGDVAIEFHAVAYEDGEGFHGPDEPRAARTGLAIWNEDPKAYWTFFGTMFKNQDSSSGWASMETLARIAKKAEVSNLSEIASQIEAGDYQSQIEKTMDQVNKLGISNVPRIVVGDTVTAPTVKPKKTRAQLDDALGKGSDSDSETTTTTETTDDESDTTTDEDGTTSTTTSDDGGSDTTTGTTTDGTTSTTTTSDETTTTTTDSSD
ncbi:thioredoxin domain-containing protein [Haladaptatus sp. DYF46]|uniref:DsbA family protein n=1 Tax=Haladaptatus sp. DYF46 TaxID=2886041 RepID=UPI001E535A33|nr:thioredoxin domain-containing protein [Haladaptatus sp. DYF46]